MKTTQRRNSKTQSARARKAAAVSSTAKIHPVIVYPFKKPESYSDLEALYGLVAYLDSEKGSYSRPITVMDRKTHYSANGDTVFHDFKKIVVSRLWEFL